MYLIDKTKKNYDNEEKFVLVASKMTIMENVLAKMATHFLSL